MTDMTAYEGRRITPDETEVAYKMTGLIPTQGITRSGQCACPIGACCAANSITPADYQNSFTLSFAALGLSSPYAYGFARGFDGVIAEAENPEYMAGYSDGTAARLRVLPEATTEDKGQ